MGSEHKRYAVVIGVSKYEDDIVELPYAKNDAYRVQSVLQQLPGFAPERVYFLANGFDSSSGVQATAPTRPNVFQKLKYVCDVAEPDDLVLLYFAGHGAEMSKTPYLITSDTKMDVLSQTALNVAELNDMLKQAKARCVLRIFDACRAPFGQGRGALGRMTDRFQEAVLKCAKGWASFCSCSSDEVAHESGELNQGVFTYYLCEGLSGKATNQQGDITIESLVDYVKTSVDNWCDRQTLRQTPHFQSDLSGSLVLASSVSVSRQEPTPSDRPFSELVAGIDQHLSMTPEDTRRLTFTSDEEWRSVSDELHAQLDAKVADLSHPAIKAQVGEMLPLRAFGTGWHEFGKDLALSGLQGEFANKVMVCEVDFISNEVVVPRTSLYVAVARFSFFYWLWYYHLCHPQQLEGRFHPDPAYTRGFFTFKPSAARDNNKRDGALTELLSRTSRDILTWAKQLREYVEARVDSLREAGPIVE